MPFRLKLFLLLTIFLPIKEASAQIQTFKALSHYETFYASAKRNTEDWLAMRRFELLVRQIYISLNQQRLPRHGSFLAIPPTQTL